MSAPFTTKAAPTFSSGKDVIRACLCSACRAFVTSDRNSVTLLRMSLAFIPTAVASLARASSEAVMGEGTAVFDTNKERR